MRTRDHHTNVAVREAAEGQEEGKTTRSGTRPYPYRLPYSLFSWAISEPRLYVAVYCSKHHTNTDFCSFLRHAVLIVVSTVHSICLGTFFSRHIYSVRVMSLPSDVPIKTRRLKGWQSDSKV